MTKDQSVNIYDAKTRFSQLVSDVEAGGEVTISRNGRPVARLVPYRPAAIARVPGAWSGRISMSADFDDWTVADDAEWYGA